MAPNEPQNSPPSPTSLSGIQVDVTTRLGAPSAATATGLRALDHMLLGGLRAGTLLAITGAPGSGKTAVSLLLAYMAARNRAGVVFASAALDQTEIVARLAARALFREFPETRIPYGAIWSGEAWRDERAHRQVTAAVETAVDKVGQHLHLHAIASGETTAELGAQAEYLWRRHERVVVVVDGVEALFAAAGGDRERVIAANAGLDTRVCQVSYELRALAELGCAVVVTAHQRHAGLVAVAATLGAELREVADPPLKMPERLLAFGTRSIELVVAKNRIGPTGIVPLRFVAGASVFEERAP